MSEQRMAGSEEFRDAIEERKGTEWYDDASKVGNLHDARIDDNQGKEMYSGAEIRAEMRAGRGDMSTEELTKQYEDQYASGEINLNGNAKDFLKQHYGATLMRNDKGSTPDEPDVVIDDPVVTPTDPTPVSPFPIASPSPGPIQTINPGNPGDTDGLNVNVNQDNDIINNINGNDNVVTNNQDNSISVGGYSKGSVGSDFKNMWMNNFFN
jgi:hypothetical protein